MQAWQPQATCRTACLWVCPKPLSACEFHSARYIHTGDAERVDPSGCIIRPQTLPLFTGDVDLWERMITLNLITPMRLTRYCS